MIFNISKKLNTPKILIEFPSHYFATLLCTVSAIIQPGALLLDESFFLKSFKVSHFKHFFVVLFDDEFQLNDIIAIAYSSLQADSVSRIMMGPNCHVFCFNESLTLKKVNYFLKSGV